MRIFLPYIGTLVVFVGIVCTYADIHHTETEPMWPHVPVVLAWGLTGLGFNTFLSLVISHHQVDETGGSPMFSGVGNVLFQLVLYPASGVYAYWTWEARTGHTAGLWEYLERPIGSVNAEASHRPDALMAWMCAVMMLKDFPWLIQYHCYLIIAHHVGCLAMCLLVLEQQVAGGRFLIPGVVGVAEFGSAFYTLIALAPESLLMNQVCFWITTATNVIAMGLIVCHCYVAPLYTASWWAFLIIGIAIVYARQDKSNYSRRVHRLTGSAFGKDPRSKNA